MWAFQGPDGWDAVLCALNTFGQDNIYKFNAANANSNAYCLRGPMYASHGYQDVYRASRCKVNFGSGSGSGTAGPSSKRGVDDEWAIECKFSASTSGSADRR